MRTFHCFWFCLLVPIFGGLWCSGVTADDGNGIHEGNQDRPNVVWIMSEDNSKHYLELYQPGGAATPNIQSMAESGVQFQHAFSNAPVCSVARTTLITGVFAPRLGTHFHRRIRLAELPAGWEMFPAYLRKAGYYTSNNAKEDYNCVKAKDVWDASGRQAHWRNRGKVEANGKRMQPFFHVQTFTDSHESSLHFKQDWLANPDLKTDPKQVKLAPSHPDTKLFRQTHARYLDRIGVIDQKVGRVLAELREAGELENTFVFYFGDHGGVLPRGKGYVYESGLHVPLVVRVPEKWKARSPFAKNSKANGFVQFVDFGPTVLNLAGVTVPQHMDGKPFMGDGVDREEVESRNTTFGYADRMDEKYDMCRSIRIGNWKYIRNYNAIYPDSLQNNYRYEMLAYQEWRQRFQAKQLNETQQQFFLKKPAEMLFDLSKDPFETVNLAAVPAHRDNLNKLRSALKEQLVSIQDLGFCPESMLVDQLDQPLIGHGPQLAKSLDEYLAIVDLANVPASEAEQEEAIKQLYGVVLEKENLFRYWALTSLATLDDQKLRFKEKVQEIAKQDPQFYNRIRAAELLGMNGENPFPYLTKILTESKSSTVNLMALQSWVLFRDGPFEYDGADQLPEIAAIDSQVMRRIGYLTGLSSAETKKRMKALMKKNKKRK